MNRPPPICITFAGPVGSSKTPIATHLSWNLGLPVMNNDALRSEVTEDFFEFRQAEYEARRDDRLRRLVASQRSFIADASVDREWWNVRPLLEQFGYAWFVISLDLSKAFLGRLYAAKGYAQSAGRIDQLIAGHRQWLDAFAGDVGLRIDDRTFPRRLALSLAAATAWLAARRAGS